MSVAPAHAASYRDMAPIREWDVNATLAECPAWFADDAEALYWIDILSPSVNRLDLATGKSTERRLPAKVGAATRDATGEMLVALETGLWRLGMDGSLRQAAPLDMKQTHFNDGKCDPAGRFWVGSRASNGALSGGSLYRVDAEGAVVLETGLDVPNGLGWNADASAFYLVDTVPRLLYRYDFDLTAGTIAGRRILHDFSGTPGKPDGIAIDAEGNIWCAMWDGGGILILSAEGNPTGWVDTGCPRPTSCAFGGPDGRTLFVTSASFGLDRADPRFGRSGRILAFRAPAPGAPVAPLLADRQ